VEKQFLDVGDHVQSAVVSVGLPGELNYNESTSS
jgi:hypothetical protein